MEIRSIESRLAECANVREACVVPVPSAAGTARRRYRAFVVLGKDTPAVREHFHVHCRVRLKHVRLAVDMQMVASLPRTAAGAVSRRALAALTVSDSDNGAGDPLSHGIR